MVLTLLAITFVSAAAVGTIYEITQEPIAAANFRRALTISQNDYSIFYTSPVACIILLVSLLVLLKPVYDDFRAGRKAAA